jgi:uncharacterized protein (DUF305 family)
MMLAGLAVPLMTGGALAQQEHNGDHPAPSATDPATPAVPRQPADGPEDMMPDRGNMPMMQGMMGMDHGRAGGPGNGGPMPGMMGRMGGMRPGMMGDMEHAAGRSDDPVTAALAAINRRMHADMTIEPSGDPDRDFAEAMIAHHEGAIDMAKLVLGFGDDPDIRKLAEGIISVQKQEIAILRQWLAKQS